MLRNLGVLNRIFQYRLFPVEAQRTFAQKITSNETSGKSKSAATSTLRDEISNEPIKYFGSQAASWQARSTRSGGADETLWFQPYVISGSLAIFMIYFFILREENDIDRKLEGNLFEHVSGLEEMQLSVTYKYNRENGLDTKDIEKRLTELGIDVRQLETQRLAEIR